MRNAILIASAAAAIFGGVALPLAAPAMAAGPTLTCNIQPGNPNYTSPRCGTSYARNTYSIGYLVQGGTGAYTYTWTRPAPSTILAGCTATSDNCEVSVAHGQQDQSYVATVVLTQNGVQTTLKVTAFISGVCGDMFC